MVQSRAVCCQQQRCQELFPRDADARIDGIEPTGPHAVVGWQVQCRGIDPAGGIDGVGVGGVDAAEVLEQRFDVVRHSSPTETVGVGEQVRVDGDVHRLHGCTAGGVAKGSYWAMILIWSLGQYETQAWPMT